MLSKLIDNILSKTGSEKIEFFFKNGNVEQFDFSSYKIYDTKIKLVNESTSVYVFFESISIIEFDSSKGFIHHLKPLKSTSNRTYSFTNFNSVYNASYAGIYETSHVLCEDNVVIVILPQYNYLKIEGDIEYTHNDLQFKL